ncbi:MAG: acetolactate synthase large subunit [Pigmentiphaga sp.]|nr:acetolactate synthase large subunit [Pigmentiphaga sp.]
MNGAEALLRTLGAAGIDTYFANPGTSEMHSVAALDAVPEATGILTLAEGVATGAADGYGRMARRPAATLLHCGPGLANGIANLHNARRARTSVVNLVGDVSSLHRAVDPPLAADIESLAHTVSSWTRRSLDGHSVARDGAEAVAAAVVPGSAIATLILPSDVCWSEGAQTAMPRPPRAPAPVQDAAILHAAKWLREGAATALLLGGDALIGPALQLAGAIAAATGVRLLTESTIPRIERGQGRPGVQRIPYAQAPAIEALAATQRLLVVGARRPVFSFAGPDGRSYPEPEGLEIAVLSHPEDDTLDALERLAEALRPLGDARNAALPPARRDAPASGAVTPEAFAHSIAALLPDDAIVVEEGLSFGRAVFPAMAAAAPHDWMQLTGGAIGSGLPMATGASIAAPGRRVVNLQSDGAALYTVPALWTQARYGLDVTTVIFSNRSYATLFDEMKRMGAVPGKTASHLLSLAEPSIDWLQVARGFGVEAERATSMEEFNAAFLRSIRRPGPSLIELVI